MKMIAMSLLMFLGTLTAQAGQVSIADLQASSCGDSNGAILSLPAAGHGLHMKIDRLIPITGNLYQYSNSRSGQQGTLSIEDQLSGAVLISILPEGGSSGKEFFSCYLAN